VFNTSPTFVTPILGVASATSVTATGTLTGSQLISTVAPGTAPLVVTSTTPVTNLSIGGNAATATTATTATNLAGGVAGDIFYQSAPNTTAKLNKGTAGQVLTMNPGATAPIWAAAGGGSVSAFNYAYTATNPTAALSITATGGPYIATVPVLIDGSTADAGLMVKADKTKLTNFPTISGSPTTNGQVLTYNGSTANWVQPSLQYSGTTGAGTVSINNGGTSATIPVVTTAVSGLMVPADKTKLDKLPTVTNGPVSTAGQVLTSNADGTATWAAATGGSGGGSSSIYYLKITDESSSTNTSYSNALVPNLRFITVNVLSPSTSTGTWIPATDIAPNAISIEECSGGSLLIANACSTSDIADTPGGIYIILSY